MSETSLKKDGNTTEFDYVSFGQKLSSDPQMIELASLFYSPRELVDILYLCAQHKAGPEQVKKREEEFDYMLERKAEDRFNETLRKSKGRLKVGVTEDYKKWQISSHKVDIARELLQSRQEVLSRIARKKEEIENEIQRLEALLKGMDSDKPHANT